MQGERGGQSCTFALSNPQTMFLTPRHTTVLNCASQQYVTLGSYPPSLPSWSMCEATHIATHQWTMGLHTWSTFDLRVQLADMHNRATWTKVRHDDPRAKHPAHDPIPSL